jgi:hypothetical protein
LVRPGFGRFFRTLLFLGILVAVAPTTVAAAAETPLPSVDVPLLASPPPIDGSIGSAWAQASTAQLTYDFTNRRAASEPTTVSIAQDGSALDFAFDVTQKEPIVAGTVANGPSVASDDYVEVALSPDGPQGFQYAFYANPKGARYQTSSENSAYSPPWEAAVAQRPDGYTVTMRIPLSIIRAGGRTVWRAQFFRATIGSNALDVWSHDERASNAGDATFFGTLTSVGAKASAGSTRPRARAQVYALGELTTPAYGGNTSRVGADLAVPVTPTASLLASFHPDYSNVEVDQQTIAPTAFPRSYAEIRPFFTQAAQPFNYTFSCNNCPQLLYTPAIPTYRNAYAVEGTQGPLTYGAFDAVGTDRNDSAEAVDYNISNPVRAYSINLQNVTVNESGLRDQVVSLASGLLSQHTHFGEYFNYGAEYGTLVTDTSKATYYQTGILYVTATSVGVIGWQHIGSQFSPVDAYVAQNDVIGPQAFVSQTIPFKENTVLHDISANAYYADWLTETGLPSQRDASAQVNVDFKNLMTVHAYYGESGVRTFDDQFLPFDGSGFLVGYKFNTVTPTYIEYSGGPYYHGSLDSWTYLTTLPLVKKVRLSLEADRNSYYTLYPGEPGSTQWLERATLDVQFNRETQFDFGVRREIGPNLPVSYQAPDFTPVNAGNVSAALHFLSRSGRGELYLVYGDPNSLSTTPAFYVKYILYLGAPKGT